MSDDFKVIGLDKLHENMLNMATKIFPKETEKFMKVEASKLQKKTVALAKAKTNKKTGNYIKGFKRGKQVYKYADADYNIQVMNTSPHAHLIEQGHKVVGHGGRGKGKALGGFVPGKHVLKTASTAFDKEFISDLEDIADFYAKELEK